MRSSAALLVGVLLVVSSGAGIGAGYPGEDSAPTHSALPNAVEAPTGTETSATDAGIAPSDGSTSHAPTWTSDVAIALSDAPAATSNETNGTDAPNVTTRDSTEMYVSIREDGDARWNVTARFVLHDENETAAFRELVRDYESGSPKVGFTRETFERVVERANAGTDRPMALQNVSRSGSVDGNGSVGVLSISFTWTNFTHVEGSRIILGDVFWVGSTTWLPALTDDQSLIIEGPSDYYVASSNIPHTGTRISYEGPRTFENGDFSVTYAPKSTETSTTPPSNSLDFSATSGLILVLFLFGMGFGAYAVSQRRNTDADPVDELDEDVPAAASATADDGEGDATDGVDNDDEPPIELLSDEERVLRLLRENDGRMKQADIVKETNWSNAKVSQLLSKMNDDDEVDKLRIGRENLITLPDEDVTDTE